MFFHRRFSKQCFVKKFVGVGILYLILWAVDTVPLMLVLSVARYDLYYLLLSTYLFAIISSVRAH